MNEADLPEELLSFATDLWRIEKPSELTDIYRAQATRFGFPVFAFGEIDTDFVGRAVMHVVEWPAAWFELYFRERIFESDPLVGLVSRGHPPFTWTELRKTGSLTRRHLRIFDMAREFGWQGGLAISLPRGGTRFGFLSLAGASDRHLTRQSQGALATMTVLFYERFRNLQAKESVRPIHPAGLTPREIECLGHVAAGLNDRATAAKLGISNSTVHEHVESAKRKLAVRTRAEVIGVAVALGAITI